MRGHALEILRPGFGWCAVPTYAWVRFMLPLDGALHRACAWCAKKK